MTVAYVDTSPLIIVAFGENSAASLARRLDGFDRLLSSNLLEAELRAAFLRDDVGFEQRAVAGIEWVLPDRPLTHEFTKAPAAVALRGADLWPVATALYVSADPGEVSFVTLDARQGTVARTPGFDTAEAAEPS